jgi:hypothetical protein
VTEPIKPDYTGAWVGRVVPALLGGAEPAFLPQPARDADQVVLFVLDGVGWADLERHRDHLPNLAVMEGGPVTTVAPSTTGAALTSITTGATPAEHGIVGYRMRVAGELLNVLRWPTKGPRAGPDPAEVQPVPPFLGVAAPAVTRAEFAESGFTAAQLRGARQLGWHTTATMVELCRQLVEDGEPFVYAYYDGVDKVSHAHGPASELFAAEMADTDRLVGAVLDRLPAEAVLVVVSDHGQLQVGPEAVRSLDPLERMVSAHAGESRFRSLYARKGAVDDLLAAATEHLGDDAWVFTRDQLFDDGWLGHDAAAHVRGRIGDVVLAARTLTAFADPAFERETQMLGRHGSLTRDEMLVPLLATHGRR